MGGDDDNRRAGIFLRNLLQDVQAAHVGQLDIQNKRIKRTFVQRFQGLLAGLGMDDLVGLRLQVFLVHTRQRRVVFDQKQALCLGTGHWNRIPIGG